jgi:hypothetical protein
MKRVLLVGLLSGALLAPYGSRRVATRSPLPTIFEGRVGDGSELSHLECEGLVDLYYYLKTHKDFKGFASSKKQKYFVQQVNGMPYVKIMIGD